MGMGSFTSVRAQKQVRLGFYQEYFLHYDIFPRLFRDRVFNYMRRKGFSDKTSETIADEALRNRDYLEKLLLKRNMG